MPRRRETTGSNDPGAVSHSQLAQRLAEMEQSLRAQGAFFANMSHEIRTPLHGILGISRLLLDTHLDDEQARLASTIQASGMALMRIINDILDLSKLEAGKLKLEQSDLDLREVVAQVRSLLSPVASQKGLALTVSIPAELDTRARGDATRLQQVLNNLVSNAIKFTHRGSVRVAVAATDSVGSGRSFCIAVTDSGIGIERSAIDRIFDAFEQADNSTSRRYGGTGLGLAIVKRLVHEFGGDITVESAPGRGSTFSFTCCLAQPEGRPDAKPDAAPQAPRHLANRRVLLAEDNPVNQIYAQAILDKHSCETTVADNGLIAVECWRSAAFDLILMDCHMPEMDGLDSTRAIRAQEQSTGSRPTPIIGITASALPADREACMAAGMDDVLVKPFGPQEFVDMLTQWCKAPPGTASPPAPVAPSAVTTIGSLSSRPTSGAHMPHRHNLLGVLLGFQQLGRRFVDGEMDSDRFLLEACRRIAEAMNCHDVIIWTFSELDNRLALSTLACYEAQCNALIDGIEPRLERTADDWRRLIEDGYQLPTEDARTERLSGNVASGMLDVVYSVNAEPLGVLACGRQSNGGAWTHEQVQLLRRIASRIGVALQYAIGRAASIRRPVDQSFALGERSAS